MLAASAGSSRISFLGNIKLVQYYVPGFVAYGVMAACFTTLAISLVNRRETGLLKRLRLSPLPAWALLAAIFVSTLLVALVQVVLLLAVGRLAFDVHLPNDLAAFAFAVLVGVLCFAALGVAMSTLDSQYRIGGAADQHGVLRAALSLRPVVSHQVGLDAGEDLVVVSDPPLHHRGVRTV